MKRLMLSGALIAIGFTVSAQDLPTNAEPGKCYVRCKTPEVWKNEDVTIEVAPAYKRIVTYPAKYKTVTERVLVDEGGEKLVVVPARYETQNFTVVTKEASKRLEKTLGRPSVENVSVVTKEASKRLEVIPAKYEMRDVVVTVKEGYKRLINVLAKFETRDEVITVKEASQRLVVVPAKMKTITEEVVVKEASKRLVTVPAKYEMRDVVVTVKEASKRVEVVPAQYEMRDVTVVVKEASKRLEVVPATFGKEVVSYKKREYGNKLRVVPASFSKDSEVIEVRAKSAKWQMSERAPDCTSSDPNDCRYWCYKEVPAQFTTVDKTVLSADASVVTTATCNDATTPGGCGNATYVKRVMKTPPTTRTIDIPEVTKVVKKRVMVTPPSTREIDIPAVTKVVKKRVMVTPPTTREIEIPEVTTTVKKTIPAVQGTREIEIPEVTTTLKRTVMATPPSTRTVKIDEKYATIKKTVLEKDAYSEEKSVSAKYKTVTKEVLVSKGGLTTWREVECKLVNNTPLPINWNLGSATLTSGAKRIIDARLLPILKDGVAVAIESHTDARGSKTSNQSLSERRAQAVVNYLVSKGINPSKLTANGYGEARLTNRCKDGVSCTEREHAANRRTTFRVIDQK